MTVWVEIDLVTVNGVPGHMVPIRIFKSHRDAILSGSSYANWDRADAVAKIRAAVLKRDNNKCTHCGTAVTWNTMELHERKWRSRGGEVSVANSTTLCHDCHIHGNIAGHGKRRPHFGKART